MNKKGFTLIEIMVAMAIFMIVMLAAIGALFVASNSAQKAKALRSAMDNVNFAMENMSRSLRLGSNYYCTSAPLSSSFYPSGVNYHDCDNSGSGSYDGSAIIFTPYDPTNGSNPPPPIAFQLSTLEGAIQKITNNTINITAPEVKITDLKFVVRGSNPSPQDATQPSVYITIKGVVTIKGEETSFAIQTLASQRNADN